MAQDHRTATTPVDVQEQNQVERCMADSQHGNLVTGEHQWVVEPDTSERYLTQRRCQRVIDRCFVPSPSPMHTIPLSTSLQTPQLSKLPTQMNLPLPGASPKYPISGTSNRGHPLSQPSPTTLFPHQSMARPPAGSWRAKKMTTAAMAIPAGKAAATTKLYLAQNPGYFRRRYCHENQTTGTFGKKLPML